MYSTISYYYIAVLHVTVVYIVLECIGTGVRVEMLLLALHIATRQAGAIKH